MGLLLKGMSLNEGWVGVFTNYGFGYVFFFFWRIFFYGNADSLIVYVRGQAKPQAG